MYWPIFIYSMFNTHHTMCSSHANLSSRPLAQWIDQLFVYDISVNSQIHRDSLILTALIISCVCITWGSNCQRLRKQFSRWETINYSSGCDLWPCWCHFLPWLRSDFLDSSHFAVMAREVLKGSVLWFGNQIGRKAEHIWWREGITLH